MISTTGLRPVIFIQEAPAASACHGEAQHTSGHFQICVATSLPSRRAPLYIVTRIPDLPSCVLRPTRDELHPSGFLVRWSLLPAEFRGLLQGPAEAPIPPVKCKLSIEAGRPSPTPTPKGPILSPADLALLSFAGRASRLMGLAMHGCRSTPSLMMGGVVQFLWDWVKNALPESTECMNLE